jgi:alpha-mannosidase
MRWDVCPSDNQIVLVKKENKQLINKSKVFCGKTIDNFQVWYKSVKIHFSYERKKVTVDADKIDWVGGRVERTALFSHQSC